MPSKELNTIVRQSYDLAHLDMSEEEVLSSKKNPFVPKLLGWTGGLLIACVTIGLILGLGNRLIGNESVVETISIFLSCGSTFFVYKVVALLVNCIRFQRVKRSLQKENKTV